MELAMIVYRLGMYMPTFLRYTDKDRILPVHSCVVLLLIAAHCILSI